MKAYDQPHDGSDDDDDDDDDNKENNDTDNNVKDNNYDRPPHFVVPRKSRQEHAKRTYHRGRWSDTERLLFLLGMRMFGMGRWKEIGALLTSR
jgi:hypothetical protein